jgi:hypothetical protein
MITVQMEYDEEEEEWLPVLPENHEDAMEIVNSIVDFPKIGDSSMDGANQIPPK